MSSNSEFHVLQPTYKEGMTSSEFDQFLAERASGTRPKRTDKDEDPMFGL
jgi:hypothetical protein